MVLSASASRTVMLATGIHAGISGDITSPPFSIGESVKVRVLNVDFETHVLDVTTVPELVKAGRKKRRKDATQLEVGAKVDAVILLRKPRYLVVETKETSVIGFVQLADYHTPARTSEDFVEGAEISVVVQRPNRPGDEATCVTEANAYPQTAHALFVLLQEQQQLRRAKQTEIQKGNGTLSPTLSVTPTKQLNRGRRIRCKTPNQGGQETAARA